MSSLLRLSNEVKLSKDNIDASYPNDILYHNNTTDDLNNMTHGGFYTIYATAETNKAPATGWLTVIVIPHGGGRTGNTKYCQQLAFRSGTTAAIYFRGCQNGTWGTWQTLHG